MKTYFECISCFVRQTLDAVRLVTEDEAMQEHVLRQALHEFSKMDLRQSPPVMGQRIHRLIRKLTSQKDPYRGIKDRFNALALELYPQLKQTVEASSRPRETAMRLAIAGNIIDFGVNSQIDSGHVHEAIEHALTTPLEGEVEAFYEAVSQASSILYVADNAGEIVFDKLLLEQMPREKVIVSVKGFPIINDATMIDVRDTGLDQLVKVIDNGSDAPGTILEECHEEFRRHFNETELIIAKGQGNYETLSETEKDIFFLLKAKCPVVAKHLGCRIGSLVLRRSDRVRTSAGIYHEGPA